MIFQENQEIKLKGKSQKGKQRIREYGETWFILVSHSCRILVVPKREGEPNNYKRWIDLPIDSDMEILSCT